MGKDKIASFVKFLGYIILPVVLLASILTIVLKRDRNISKTFSSENAKAEEGSTNVKAFPGAEGFGAAETKGGRGGKIYKITNLNDSGSGSLRECVEASGARICIFEVGGTINLEKSLTINHPYITIAGQTASGGGITLKNIKSGDIFSTETNDIVIRYITGRPGPTGENHAVQNASTNPSALYNIIYDHCSFSWGVDSVWETWWRVIDTTIQWSFVNEGLDFSVHSKNQPDYGHSKGLMVGGYATEDNNSPGSERITVHHNLIAHNRERAPQVQSGGIVDVVNNVGYNTRSTFSHVDMGKQKAVVPVNYIGNYFKPGPQSKSGIYGVKVENDGSLGAKIYVQGNISPQRTSDTQAETKFVDPNATKYVVTNVNTPNSLSSITTTSATTAYDQVLSNAGNSKGLDCSGNWFTRRDAVDRRVVEEVRSGQGKIIDGPSEKFCLGDCTIYLTSNDYTKFGINYSTEIDGDGWPVIVSGTKCDDTDNDGMPDAWEDNHGLNKNLTDNNGDADGDGYTNIENYLNGSGTYTGPTFTPVPTTPISSPTPTKTPTPIPPSPTRMPTLTPSPTKVPTQIPPTPTVTPFIVFSTPTQIPTSVPTLTLFPTPTSNPPLPEIDVLTIKRATYKSYRWFWWSMKRITVIATSSQSPNVKLTLQNYGPLGYSSMYSHYSGSFYTSNIPSFVTVISDKGGSITYPLTSE